MNVTISERAKKILRILAPGEPLSRAAIESAVGETRINTIRELNFLIAQQLVSTSGEARATVYQITDHGRTTVVWDVEEYLAHEPDARGALYTRLEPKLLQTVKGIIGPTPVVIESAAQNRRQLGGGISAHKELERFVIELSWKSSKIEGNTYSLLDTERLLRDAAEAPGHPKSEAIMIINHKRAFEYVWQHKTTFQALTIIQIRQIHQLLIEGLGVPTGLREHPVGITGTVYIPPASRPEIAAYLDDVVDIINSIDEPIEKAMAALVLLAYLHPFADGNKRTSRLIANAILLAYGFPPLSYRSVDEQAYKGALILFYEQGSLANFRELYLKQLEESALSYYFPTSEK